MTLPEEASPPLSERAARRSNGHQAEAAARVAVSAPPAARRPAYGGLITRTIAFVLDAAIIDAVAALTGVAIALVISLLPVSHKHNTTLLAIGGGVFFVWAAAYFVIFWSTTGQTPGNRAMQIRVTGIGGGPLRPRNAIVRVVGVVAAIIPLGAGLLPILFTPKRRGLQDWLAGSVVVSAPPRR